MSSDSSHTHAAELARLDQLTSGVFSAASAADRASRVHAWLASQPAEEDLQRVYRELSAKDKGSAKHLRERLDELKRLRQQEELAQEWSAKAQTLLSASRMNLADALAWQRDAAKAGAPLSREPLLQLKTRLAEKIQRMESLHHQVQVQREAAVLLAQRIELLSTKSWPEADAAEPSVGLDVDAWTQAAQRLKADADWDQLDLRMAPQLDTSQSQLLVVWEAYRAAVNQGRAALVDASLPLPDVPLWHEALRPVINGANAVGADTKSDRDASAHQVERAEAEAVVGKARLALEQEIEHGHGKASASAANALRAALKAHSRWLNAEQDRKAQLALAAASELESWQRWRADQLREQLVSRAESLTQRPEGQALGGKKLQEALKELRAQWKEADQGGVSNHALWRRFDEACNAAHKLVEVWLQKVKAESAEHRTRRLALIEELKSWAAQQGADTPADSKTPMDWRGVQRRLQQFSEQWRDAGHLSDRAFAELQPLWKAAWSEAHGPLDAAQKASIQLRQSLIEEARKLGAAPQLRIDAIKALQQRWQTEAHAVPLDRRQEQKLWEAFRQPIDEAFERKSAAREQAVAALSAHDQQVLDAAKVLEAAIAAGDAAAIRTAMQTLEDAMHGAAAGRAAEPPTSAPRAPEVSAAAADADVDAGAGAKSVPDRKPVLAVRGDDRPGARLKEVAADTSRKPDRASRATGAREMGAKGGRFDDRRAERVGRPATERHGERPRLGDQAFRAQRDAVDHAQAALRKLAAQAHGEALTQLVTAWEQRDAKQVPAAGELGRLPPATRAHWVAAIEQSAASASADAQEALLRLEMAAEVPTPAEDLDARRALQLKLLTQRHAATPAQTWTQDVARLLSQAHQSGHARRLMAALKVLLRR